MAMKVLVAGDVEGSITALFKRVDAVNKKAGEDGSEVLLNQSHKYLWLQDPSRCCFVWVPSLVPATQAGQITRPAGEA